MSNQTHPAREDHRTVRPPTSPGLDLNEVRKAVEGIRYGEVRLIIQDGIIVQIDRMEKRRLR
ncbi:MAG: YezD family protein [Isosphaeraceae bacterium]